MGGGAESRQGVGLSHQEVTHGWWEERVRWRETVKIVNIIVMMIMIDIMIIIFVCVQKFVSL